MTFTISQSPNSSNLYLYPTGDSSCSLTASAGSNFECVDEVWHTPNEDTDYVYTDSISSTSDWYTMQNHTTETGTINYVQIIGRAKSNTYAQSSSGIYRLWVDDTSSTASSSNQVPLTTSFSKYYNVFTTKPSGGAWTWTDIDAMLIGVECSSPSINVSGAEYIYRLNSDDVTELTAVGDTNNYECIDEEGTHDGDTTYVSSPYSSYLKDFYGTPNGIGQGTINYVQLTAYHRGGAADASHYICNLAKIGGVEFILGDSGGITSSTWQNYTTTTTSSPSTSIAWTWDEVNSMKIGVGLRKRYNTFGAYCTQLYMLVNYEKDNENPQIRTTQAYAVVNYTPPESTVTLNTPDSLTVSHSRNVGRYTFPAGDYEVTDYGRSGKALSLTGLEYASADTEMASIKDMCHYGEKVTIAGLNDTNLNTDYMIRNFTWSEEAGHMNRMYRWNLSLEEV